MYNFQTHHSLWNNSLMNATEPNQSEVNIGSGNGMVLSGNSHYKSTLTQIYVTIWYGITRPQWVKFQNHFIIQMRFSYNSTKFYGTTWHSRDQWVNSLGPSDAIGRQRSGLTLAQVMACCLTAPSHYLHQCWLIISKIQLHSSDGNFTRDTSVISD